MAEYEAREQRIPDQLGQLIASFAGNINDAHRANQLGYAEYIQQVVAIQNITWAVEIGILTIDQALTLTASLPVIALIDTSNFGFKRATLDVEFKVSASQEDTTSLKTNVATEAKMKIGGIAALFGAGGSVSIKADTTYQKDTRRASDYSSTVKAHIEMERLPPPEGVQIMCDTTNEVVREGMLLNKEIIRQQFEKAQQELDGAEVPQKLPEPKAKGEQAAA